ncbi:hydantoinase B/oxoprolinase family protein [Parageobacillus thermoglucosidasius]|uniref:Acetone carboxylase subunit alpha n=2 Tax=Anoxybacillaceae TaxID=3120669 RepID=A0AAN0YN78_PARTM|nr:hydantoinase B/oxoprolinase family protein [Parageobacillus thermoglucosidasius]REK55127.1 MAG: acetone carboxylase subunit alpha [Geobacillus sp.]AEH48496.1 Hydantoinase B/oxoprolinase [Parageobacillus thermoglucosidasius C56-YS93]ALF10238.1 acetone carboxylase subunit alpha [Parageobacillus thermoglucosidasius]ANZ30320.1 acetone carboxylase subunit alpha [Parageobacillus thermoglucosidasius]APM81058.1 acetone carboxylase subunit alpha [Parageobacillus thermoglucosidasius]
MAMNIREEKKHKTIGWNGKTLKEMREEIDRLSQLTGHYAGLKELPLKESDPIRYEKIFSKLRGGVVHARETAKRVAASPIVEQEGELCFTLYTPEGDSIVTSTGIIIHVGTMGAAIKFMIKNDYEENPGIEDGDIFCNNDCQIGNVHPCDVHTIVPIFYEGELIGWVGGVTHVIDVGATAPGSMTVGPVTRYDDGYQVACRKIGKNDTLLKDWLIESQRSVRTTKYWLLDERTRIAGCHMIRDLVLDIVKEEGIDTYKQFIREVIEEGRRGFINQVKTLLIPGRYRQVSFVDVPYKNLDVPPYARVDTIMHAPTEIIVHKDGKFEIDFEGVNRWGWHSYNATPVSITSGIWVMMSQTLIPNDRVNDGAYYASKFDLPYGSWLNPDDIRTAHSYAWHFLVSAWSPLWRGLSRNYFARGYLEEVNAGNANTSNWLQGGGYNQFNENHAVNSFESAAEGVGASAVRDGISHAAAIWNPEGDMGDMEIWELAEPLIYLGRSIKPNTGGHGKYRGGNGYETLRMVYGAKDWTMFFMGNGYISSDCGLMGGYPAAAGYRFEAHGTNLKERIEKRLPIPTGGDPDPDNPQYEKLMEAKEIIRDKQAITTETIFENYDLYLNYLRGGPGFGDPLERKPKMIEDDLNEGHILPRFAESVYGAVFTQDEKGRYIVDEEATMKRREEMRKERLKRGVPTKQWMEEERKKIVNKEAAIQVRHMYASSFALSEKFYHEFKSFWDLPENWKLTEDELDVPVFGAKINKIR